MVNTCMSRAMEKHNMRIGELAERAAIKVDTVRYYEKAGLLPLPPRRPNGYRDYGIAHLERLAFIRHCRALDMPLDDVRQLLDLLAHPSADCQDANRLVDEQLARVQGEAASVTAHPMHVQDVIGRVRHPARIGGRRTG